MKHTALIVGGGLAGIAAAVALSKENYKVTLVERHRFLGGRASAFPLENGWLDNCQHVVLGSCASLLDLLTQLNARQLVEFYPEIPFLSKGKTTLIRPSLLPVPFHYLPHFLAAPLFTLKEKLMILKFFATLLRLDVKDSLLDQTTLLDFLMSHGQTKEVIEKFWDLIFVSSLNETLARTSAKYGVMVLQETFLRKRDGGYLGTPKVSLAELYHLPALDLFKNKQVTLIHENVKALELNGKKPQAILDDGTVLEADRLISAVPFYNLFPLLSQELRANHFFDRAQSLETSPILGIHLWFDRSFTPYPFGALPGSPIHWFFAKPKNEIGHYLQCVISACREYMTWTSDALITLGVEELKKYFPAIKRTNLIQAKVVRETRATFSPNLGCDQFRPPQKTPIANFYLAGDWTDTGWPSTMEGAVRSGYQAARAIQTEDTRKDL